MADVPTVVEVWDFIVFGLRQRITFGAMDHAPARKRKRGAESISAIIFDSTQLNNKTDIKLTFRVILFGYSFDFISST